MISASKEFKEKLKKDRIPLANYADVTLPDGIVLHLEPKDFLIGGCTIEDKTTDGKFGVGFVIGKNLSIKLENKDERFSQYDFYGASVCMYVAMLLDDGKIEKIRKGVYYVTVPSTQGDIIEISAVDGMFKLDREYSASNTIYPASLHRILTDACNDCGIPIGFRQFDNYDFTVKEKPEGVTYRQVVSYVAQVAGYNARIDNDGYMQLVWYDTTLIDRYSHYDGGNFKTYPHDTVIDGGDFKNYGAGISIQGALFTDTMPEHVFRTKTLDIHTDDVLITGVRVVGEDDVSVLFGEEGYVIEITGNPFVNGAEEQVANYLGILMVGIFFRPLTVQILDNPLYEPFEVVRVSDRKGNFYISIINSVSYSVGSYTQIACEAEDPTRNGSSYASSSAAAVVEARRNTEKQLTTYDKAVQNMNQIAMNAMGYHTTYEEQPDGSRITYLHDRPTLEDSTTIYKQTIDGFFISTDGGKSYTAGFDKNGNAVVNILYAIGVVADWIRTGKFIAEKDGKTTFMVDVDTGVVEIIADSFSLSNGKTIQDIADEAVDGQTQADIFNKLTNYGEAKGIWLKDNQLYISFTYAHGGTLTLGGINNGNGTFQLLDENENPVVKMNKDVGLSVEKGNIRGTNITIGGVDNSDGAIYAYGSDNNPSYRLYSDALAFYYKNWDAAIGSFSVARYSNSSRTDLEMRLYEDGEAITWNSFEDGGVKRIFEYYKQDKALYAYVPMQVGDISANGITANSIVSGIFFLGSDNVGKIQIDTKGMSLLSDSGNKILLGEGNSYQLTVDSSSVVIYTESECYGDLNMHGYSILNNSDERLKTNIEESDTDALSTVNDIQTYSFDWIENGTHEDLGFIAQQLETVNPDFVKISERDGHYSVKEMKLIPYLVKSVQELSTQVDELQAQIAELKGETRANAYVTRQKKRRNKWTPTAYTDEEKAEFVERTKPRKIEVETIQSKPIITNG